VLLKRNVDSIQDFAHFADLFSSRVSLFSRASHWSLIALALPLPRLCVTRISLISRASHWLPRISLTLTHLTDLSRILRLHAGLLSQRDIFSSPGQAQRSPGILIKVFAKPQRGLFITAICV